MSETAASYRRILRTSSIIGGASVINILIGLVRTKVVAVLLGPIGIGLLSLYNGFISTASVIATMGVGTVGTRQIAEAYGTEDERALTVARRAMFWGSVSLACAAAFVVWSFRRTLAERVLGSATHAGIVGWLSLGVALSVASASQGALIQGMRRIGDMARLSVWGAVLNTVFGILLLWHWGKAGLVAYVLIGPVSSFVLGHIYVSRLPKPGTYDITLQEVVQEWKMLLRLGIPFVGAGMATSLIQLWIRIDIGNVLGPEALGHSQAAWTVSTQYIGFVLGAMAADYYPRLTGVIRDRDSATRLVNEQTEIAMLLSAPAFIAMMGLAPWVIRLLYSGAFAPSVEVLRWQVLGDVLKVASWPLGFVILAAGDGKTYFFSEASAQLVMGAMIAGLAPVLGLRITGISSLACYVFYLPLTYWLARRRIGFRWSRPVFRLLLASLALAIVVGVVATITAWGILLGCVVAAVLGIYSIGRVSHMSDIGGPAGQIGNFARRLSAGIGLKHD